MRFLVFNVVVAAALVYLFTADRAEVGGIADRAVEAAGNLRLEAENLVAGEPAPPVVSAEPAPAPAAPRTSEREPVALLPGPELRPEPVPAVAPEVATRRAEVLAEAGPPAEPTAIADDPAPDAGVRRRELHRLAEEMELFSAEAASR